MFRRVIPHSKHLLSEYQSVLGPESIEKLYAASQGLKGYKIVEINSTAEGGGVAELLTGQISLTKQLGLDIGWYVMPADKRFFGITKELHNRLQGVASSSAPLDMQYYQSYLSSIASSIPDADLYILHDPQTLGLVPYLQNKRCIWRCHIDLTNAQSASYDWLKSHYHYFDKLVFTLSDYAHSAPKRKVSVIEPSIDPLSDKNREMSTSAISSQLRKLGLHDATQYILQVSRFDKFKDPVGVVRFYQKLVKNIPDLECVLAGSYADDDPEGAEYYKLTQQAAQGLKHGKLHILLDNTSLQVNALQRAASLVVQNSSREGFGLTVTEAMYKQKVILTRPVGGITKQIVDGKTGFYFSSDTANTVDLATDIILHPEKYTTVPHAAYLHVKKHFVLPHMLSKYLSLYSSVLKSPKS